MALQGTHVVIGLGLGVKVPQLDQVVAAAGDEPPQGLCLRGGGLGAGELARSETRAPGNGIDAEAVGGEDGVAEGVVDKGDDGDGAVGRGAGQVAAGLGRRPGNQVD